MEVEEFVEKLQKWHAHKVAQLKQITEQADAVIHIGDMEIEPLTDMAKGFRVGVLISLELLGKLPFSAAPICDACGEPITEDQTDVGHECNLHEHCAEDGSL